MVRNRLQRDYDCGFKPQSNRIVRYMDRTIGCDLANVRAIDNVCYDLQKRSHTAIGLLAGGRSSYDWSYA